MNEKTTIYINPKVKRSVQHYALRDRVSLSEIINQKLLEYLEDMADAAALAKARQETGDLEFEQVVQDLGLDIHEIRRQVQAERKQTTKKT